MYVFLCVHTYIKRHTCTLIAEFSVVIIVHLLVSHIDDASGSLQGKDKISNVNNKYTVFFKLTLSSLWLNIAFNT